MNTVLIMGRLTKDPELKYTSKGTAITNFVLAVNRPGDKENIADFPRIIAIGKVADNLCKYTEKGNRIVVEGKIQTRTYKNKGGENVYLTEILASKIEYLDFKRSDENKKEYVAKNDYDELDIVDEDLPF